MEPLSGSHDTNDIQQQGVMPSVAFLIGVLSVIKCNHAECRDAECCGAPEETERLQPCPQILA